MTAATEGRRNYCGRYLALLIVRCRAYANSHSNEHDTDSGEGLQQRGIKESHVEDQGLTRWGN